MKKFFSKKKIVPLGNICSICYSNLGKDFFKCHNEKCIDGVICNTCQKSYQTSGLAKKCPICRNESDAFIIEITNNNSDENLQKNRCCCKLKKNNICESIFINKMCFLFERNCCGTSLSCLVVTLFIGWIESNILNFGQSDPMIWFFLGLITILIVYLISWCYCSNFCIIIHYQDD